MTKSDVVSARRRAVVLAGLFAAMLLTAGCATPEARVRSGLANVGISQPVAACMAERMVDRLNLLQLRRLSRMSTLGEGGVGGLTMEQYLHRARVLGDAEIWTVVSTSAGICALRR